MVTGWRASVLLHAWCYKNGDGLPTNPFQICSFLLLQPRHILYLNVHALLAIVHPTRCGVHPPKPSTTHVPVNQDALYATTIVCENHIYYQTKKTPAHAGFDRAHCTVPTSIVPCLLLDFANKFVVWMNSELGLKSSSIWVRRVAESWFGYLILASQ
jgi:hypothetical protein